MPIGRIIGAIVLQEVKQSVQFFVELCKCELEVVSKDTEDLEEYGIVGQGYRPTAILEEGVTSFLF